MAEGHKSPIINGTHRKRDGEWWRRYKRQSDTKNERERRAEKRGEGGDALEDGGRKSAVETTRVAIIIFLPTRARVIATCEEKAY